jgi:hypothetical protein
MCGVVGVALGNKSMGAATDILEGLYSCGIEGRTLVAL